MGHAVVNKAQGTAAESQRRPVLELGAAQVRGGPQEEHGGANPQEEEAMKMPTDQD